MIYSFKFSKILISSKLLLEVFVALGLNYRHAITELSEHNGSVGKARSPKLVFFLAVTANIERLILEKMLEMSPS